MSQVQVRELFISVGGTILMVTGAVTFFSYAIAGEISHYLDKDVMKALVGSFAGAGLAFLANRRFQKQAQTREDKAAFHLALAILRAKFEGFLNYRYALHNSVVDLNDKYQRLAPNDPAPIWALARPFRFTFSPIESFDLKSLIFLFDKNEGRDAFTQLQLVERTFLELAGAHIDLHESAQEVQTELSKHANDGDASWLVYGLHLGPALSAKAGDNLISALLRTDRDEDRYIECMRLLDLAALTIFRKDLPKNRLIQREEFKKNRLRTLPDVVRAGLDSVPEMSVSDVMS
jgi:hypothetical protein